MWCGCHGNFVSQCLIHQKGSTLTSSAERTTTPLHASLVSPSKLYSHQSFTCDVQISHSGSISVLSALIDSGATGNFINHDTVFRLELPTEPRQHPMKTRTINRRLSGTGLITLCHQAPPAPNKCLASGVHLLPHYGNHQAPHNSGTTAGAMLWSTNFMARQRD